MQVRHVPSLVPRPYHIDRRSCHTRFVFLSVPVTIVVSWLTSSQFSHLALRVVNVGSQFFYLAVCPVFMCSCQDRDRWRTLVSAVMNLLVPWNAGNVLTSCKPVSFSRRTLHHGVSKFSNWLGTPSNTAPGMVVGVGLLAFRLIHLLNTSMRVLWLTNKPVKLLLKLWLLFKVWNDF